MTSSHSASRRFSPIHGSIWVRYIRKAPPTKARSRVLPNFGAFITLEPGIDGLVHISELGKTKRIKHPGEVLDKARPLK